MHLVRLLNTEFIIYLRNMYIRHVTIKVPSTCNFALPVACVRNEVCVK